MAFTHKESYLFLTKLSEFFITQEKYFNSLDNIAGDGDHGSSLARGAKRALADLPSYENSPISVVFGEYAKSFIASIGGAIGPIYGMFFLQFSRQLKENKAQELTGLLFTKSLGDALTKIKDLGGANVGDKTIIDALAPAYEAALESMKTDDNLYAAVKAAHIGAEQGRITTIDMIARKGRSKYVREQAIGHADAGASSLTAIFSFWQDFLDDI